MKKLKAILFSLLLACASAFTSVTAFADAIIGGQDGPTAISVTGSAVVLIVILGFIALILIGAAVALFFIIRYFVKRNKN
ncbi:MAG: hypothetical protein IJF27_05105 [Oscillospiraceae bacterium]|nr:hypothetical protein [Oscillospiraceae bacterium]MBQ9938940.1 hypothetical protein [Oscillospiraceae bacterium]